MTDQRELDRLLGAYFVEGTNELADRVIDAALDQIDHTHQRRPLGLPWRFHTMSMPIRVASAAVIGVLAIGGAALLLRPGPAAVGGPGPSPSPSAVIVPTWVPTGAMSTGRASFGSTLLTDGTVLAVGGVGPSGGLTSAERFDPSRGTWTAIPSMLYEHGYEAAATRLLDGRVLVTGGGDPVAELYDLATGSWTKTAPLSRRHSQHMATLLADGRVLVAGGTEGDTPVAGEIYDPTAGTWSETGIMVAWRASSSMVSLPNGKVLVAGGFTPDQRSAELFDPVTGAWTATGEMADMRGDGQTATMLPNGKVLVVGGGSMPTAELYDPATGAWTATGPMVKATNGQTATLLPDGRVLVAGGLGAVSDSDALTVAQVYDPATSTWAATTPMHEARISAEQDLLPDGRVLVFGGNTTASGGTFLTSSELYVH